MSNLKRFWFQFERSELLPPGVRMGCGVTAFDIQDATVIIQERVFGVLHMPRPLRITEDIDVSSLDSGHVLPNMGNPVARGVWFPLGY